MAHEHDTFRLQEHAGNLPDSYETLEENGIRAYDSGIEILQRNQDGWFRKIHAAFGWVSGDNFNLRINVEQLKNVCEDGKYITLYNSGIPQTLDLMVGQQDDSILITVLRDLGYEKIPGVLHAVNMALLSTEWATKNPIQEPMYVSDVIIRRGQKRNTTWFDNLHKAIALTGKPGVIREVA